MARGQRLFPYSPHKFQRSIRWLSITSRRTHKYHTFFFIDRELKEQFNIIAKKINNYLLLPPTTAQKMKFSINAKLMQI